MPRKLMKGADFNGQRAVNAADPSAATDLVTKQYADALTRNLSWKEEVVAASTGNVALAAPGTTLDGVTLTSGDRVLLKDQTAAAENGIYVWTGAASALTRATDADNGTRLSGATTTVQRGTTNADRVYRSNADDPITVGTTALPWAQVGGASTPYIGGAGLTLTGQSFDVGQGAGIIVSADSIAVDTNVVTRKYAADCAATTNPQTFTHGLGTDVSVDVWEGNAVVDPDITKAATSGGQVTIDWGSAPTAGQYRVVIIG